MVWTGVSSILRLSQTWFESETLIVHTMLFTVNRKPNNYINLTMPTR